jgi:hypothetical protein
VWLAERRQTTPARELRYKQYLIYQVFAEVSVQIGRSIGIIRLRTKSHGI